MTPNPLTPEAIPLPQLPGPKLAPFTPSARADIEFIQEIGNRARDKDSIVWKVRINGSEQCYALKMFFFFSARYIRKTIGGYLNRELASDQLWIDYFEPFSCECRAYARLKQGDCEHSAVRAHGYLFLTPAQEDEVVRRIAWYGELDYDLDDDDLDRDLFSRGFGPLMANCPVRAIVKDLVGPEVFFFEPEHIGQMAEDLETFHRLGVLVRDIRVGNYLDGKLVDLSRSWTMPHPTLEYISEATLRRNRVWEPQSLHGCIVDLGMDRGWDWDKVVSQRAPAK